MISIDHYISVLSRWILFSGVWHIHCHDRGLLSPSLFHCSICVQHIITFQLLYTRYDKCGLCDVVTVSDKTDSAVNWSCAYSHLTCSHLCSYDVIMTLHHSFDYSYGSSFFTDSPGPAAVFTQPNFRHPFLFHSMENGDCVSYCNDTVTDTKWRYYYNFYCDVQRWNGGVFSSILGISFFSESVYLLIVLFICF